MPITNDILQYEDLRVILDEALASAKGIAVEYESKGKAIHARQRFYKLRKLDKLASCDIYSVGHHMRGASAYDSLNARLDDKMLVLTHARPLKVHVL